jgi:hypothetical protein
LTLLAVTDINERDIRKFMLKILKIISAGFLLSTLSMQVIAKVYSHVEGVQEYYQQGDIILNTSIADGADAHFYTDNNAHERENGPFTQVWVRYSDGSKEIVPTSPLITPADIHITPDGKRLIITEYGTQPSRLYSMEKTTDGWAIPQLMPISGLTDGPSYATTTHTGSIYFSVNGDIYKAQGYEAPEIRAEKLTDTINSANGEFDPFISQDESFLMFVRQDNQEPIDTNIYISFKLAHGWSVPEKLPEPFNQGGVDGSPYVTPDGKYLFISSNRHGHGVRIYQANLESYIEQAKKRAMGN